MYTWIAIYRLRKFSISIAIFLSKTLRMNRKNSNSQQAKKVRIPKISQKTISKVIIKGISREE